MKKIFYHVQIIKSSFWFVPLLLTLGGVTLAILFLYLDTIINIQPKGVFLYAYSGSTASARNTLSVIGGAMIGIAGTVFSITLVVLTLASSQFGPRLLRNFMYNRINQMVLGMYVATFLYCLMVLNSVKGNEDISFVPNLSILCALALAFVCIIFLILFIHHVSMSIQPSQVISSINRELEKSIKNYYSKNKEYQEKKDYDHAITRLKEELPIKTKITNPATGYLQYFDEKPLMSLAESNNFLLLLNFKPGEYLVKGVIIGEVYSQKALEDSTIPAIKNMFVTARDKTIFQDIEFGIEQIVEIGCKALSPGINDPFTAITCADYLTSVICNLTSAKFPTGFIEDSNGQVRIMAKTLTFGEIMDAAFNQMRQYAMRSPSVIIRLMESFITISQFIQNEEQQKALERHAKKVLDAGKSFQNEQDYADLKTQYESFLTKRIP